MRIVDSKAEEKDRTYEITVRGYRPNYGGDGDGIRATMRLAEKLVELSKNTTLPLEYGGVSNGLSAGLAVGSLYGKEDDRHVRILTRDVNKSLPVEQQGVQFDITTGKNILPENRKVLETIVMRAIEEME